jgi:hypothetical protein
MKKTTEHAYRGIEQTSSELRTVTVKSATGTRSEMMPSDPFKVAAILAERRSKPASKARAKLAAEAKRRGI